MKKRLISLLLVLALVVGICPAAFAAEATVEEPKMVDIELELTEDYGVIVSVPEDKAEEYRQRLETDPEFRQSEIDTALAFLRPSRARPEGNIILEQYMYESDIERTADDYARKKIYNAWKAAYADAMKPSAILVLAKNAGLTTVRELVSAALYISINIVATYQEDWWAESCSLVCGGEISAVRYLVIESVVEYPKAWRVFERVS